ncbi:MAG TPA: hypothetical protein PKA41_07080 [Verrucomicrobiota bacterium]|nr:hypothetical protein [Verrucomicrobiota bacterium]
MNRPALMAILVCCTTAAQGAAIVWTNVLGGDWSVAENWNPNQLPGTSDTALVTNDGDYTIIVDINPAVSNLMIGAQIGTQTVIKTNGELRIHRPSDIGSRAVLNLSATLVSTGLTVNGTVNWSGGSIPNGSSVTVASNGLLNVTGTATKSLFGSLTNQGTVLFTGQGAMNIGAAGALRIISGSLLDFQTNSTIGGTGPVINHGTLRRSSDTGTVNVTAPCTNFGIVEVQHQSIGFAQLALGDGSSYSGPGLVPFGGGTLMGDITSENLVLMSGTLSGSGRLQGVLMWTNGIIATSAMTILSNGVLISISSNPKTFNGSLTNEGKIVLSGGQITTGASPVHNRANGLIEVQNLSSWNFFSGLTVINDGIIRKTVGAGTTFIGTATFSNRGTIDCQVGTLSLQSVLIEDGSGYIGLGTNAISSATMNGTFVSENIRFQGGGLNGNGLLNGSMDWASGMLASGASLTVASNSTLKIFGFAPKTLSGMLTNSGTIIITNNGVAPSAFGAVHNLANALIELNGDGANASGVINDGVIRKSTGTGTASVTGPFVNRGTLDAASGFISLSGSGIVLGDGSSYVGAGTNITETVVSLNGSIVSENMVLEGGSGLIGTGILHGVLYWRQGGLHGIGSLTIAEDGILKIYGGVSLIVGSSLTNAGKILLTTPGYLSIHTSSSLHNLPSGTIELQSDSHYFVTSSGRFINDGTVLKSLGSGTNAARSDVQFTNNGVILAQSGTILFEGNLANPFGTLEVQGGKITSTTPLLLTNGLITGSGIIEAPSIINGATLRPGATNAILTVSGNYTQQLAGSIEFAIGGNEPGVNQSQVNITEDAKLNGTIGVRFSPGYSPEVGDTNLVLTAASLSGDFDCFNGLILLGEAKRLTCSVFPTNVMLAAIAAPDPLQPTLNIARSDQVLVCWPSEFVNYSLQTSTNLSSPDWTTIPGATNRFITTPTLPSEFFSLTEQTP